MNCESLLNDLQQSLPKEYKEIAISFKEFYQKKLWHQLAENLLFFYHQKELSKCFLLLYNEFVLLIEKDIDPVKFVRISYLLSKSIFETDPEKAYSILSSVIQKTISSSKAYLLSVLNTASFLSKKGRIEEAKEFLNQIKDLINKKETFFEAKRKFYSVKVFIAKQTHDHDSYYKNTLEYLSFVDLNSIDRKAANISIEDLCISALLSEKVYDFGEITTHPIISLFRIDTPLLFYLKQFNQGNFLEYEKFLLLLNKFEILFQNINKIKEKFLVIFLVFKVVSFVKEGVSVIPLETLSKQNCFSKEQTEQILVRSFVLCLLSGKISQTENVVRITWIKPFVLNMKQISQMKEDVDLWKKKIDSLLFTQ